MPSTPPLRKSREYSPCEFSENVRALKHTSRKHTTMHPNNILATALIAAITVAACCPSVGAASWSPTEQAMDKMLAIVQTQLETTGQAIEDTLELDGTQATADPQGQQPIARTGHNSMFHYQTPIPDLIEYDFDSCNVSTIRKAVDFGKGLGDGELIISFEDDGPHFIVKLRGREILNEPRGNAESSLAAYDFDGDGRKEVFYQNGDEFSLTVYGFKGRKLEKLGSVTCNNGLIIADDGLCASRYGSQGLCDMFRIENGKMEISEDEDIDPLLFSSDDFRNLRYSFKDTSREDRLPDPMFDADIYIMPESLYGSHVLNVNLDHDGSPEQLFIGEDPHGFSYLRLQIPGSRESYNLLHLMDHDDTVAFRYGGYNIRLRDMVQLSAKDTDGDGVLEVIVTAGSHEKNSNYIFKYNRDKELELIKRYVQN